MDHPSRKVLPEYSGSFHLLDLTLFIRDGRFSFGSGRFDNLLLAWRFLQFFGCRFCLVAASPGFRRFLTLIFGTCASAAGTVYVPGPYCREPLISTGAGDNFGAGCLSAALRGFDDAGLLLAGNCASGHFVRSGCSAAFADMTKLLDAWAAGTLGDRI